MDLLIPNSWLKKFLDTKAGPSEIAKCASLCGPSFERIKKSPDGDSVYAIEVTTNRVDSASVYGIARELSAILPRFGVKAILISRGANIIPPPRCNFSRKVEYLDASIDPTLCPRFMAVLVKDVTIKESPKEVQNLLEKSGVRAINNVVDVSNYIMKELGQPVHTFDYDKIAGHKMILREAKKGESLVTLDGKKFILKGGEIVIEDGSKKLIDLCGIMGGENSMVTDTTKNVLLFVQVYDRHHIRKTSMSLAQRSDAAVLFEKGIDPEGVKPAMIAAINLMEKITGGVANKNIIDIYPAPYKSKVVSTYLTTLENIIGIKLSKNNVSSFLKSLGFEVKWTGDKISVTVPSYRAEDVSIPEDIAEEVARIYGYHNLPSVVMNGEIPKNATNPSFGFEAKIKNTLLACGAIEVYNLSLTDKGEVKLKNPLGSDTEYLRSSLLPGLTRNLKDNPNIDGIIHLFELSAIYLKEVGNLPKEKLVLAGIIKNQDFRSNKGIIETLLDTLEINYSETAADYTEFLPGQSVSIKSANVEIGKFGNLETNIFYYEFEIQKLISAKINVEKFREPSKYPPQIEDITFIFPDRTKVGEVESLIKSVSQLVNNVELKDIFNNSYTFRIWYQDPSKTLTDKEVEEIRSKVIKEVSQKFGVTLKG